MAIASIIRNRGIAFKLVFFILSSCAVIFSSVFVYNYVVSRGLLVGKIEDSAENLTSGAVNKIESTLLPIEKVTRQLAHILERSSFSEEGIKRLLYSMVEKDADIYGGAVAFEPYAFKKDKDYFSPYYYKKDGNMKFKDLSSDEYAYHKWDWYNAPKKLKSPVWSDPYFDKGGGGILMSTYSVPFYSMEDGIRKFRGVVTADISLEWLEKYMASIKVGESGYGFLISRSGTLITHPDKKLVMDKTLEEVARIRNNPALMKVGGQMVQGAVGFMPVKSLDAKKETWISFAPVPSTNWSLAVIFPKGELMKNLYDLNRAVIFIGVIGLIFLAVVIVILSNSITRPLRVLAIKTRDVARGALDFDLPPAESRDEVGSLTESFRYMKDSLKKYIEDLTRTMSEKEKIESELKIAHRIQMGILPKIVPPFTSRNDFSIYAGIKPAREVGGDLYDFYFIDDGHLAFVVGDVSGKGVPSALFMAIAKTFIKSAAKVFKDPADILNSVNRALVRDNTSYMFITVFFGILDINTGRIRYSNAGHNPPVVLRKEKDPVTLQGDTGSLLGAFEDIDLKDGELTLYPGDALYIYTDGVTEAVNRSGEEFTEERLKGKLRMHKDDTVRGIVEGTFRGIGEFARGVPQFDDITVLALRYLGGKEEIAEASKNEKISIENDLYEIRKLADSIEEFGKNNGFHADLINDINLVLEEIICNTISYGYKDDSVHLINVFTALEGKELVIKIIDDAEPFDPLGAPSPDIDKPAEEKTPGGLGIFLVRTIMDELKYERKENSNILILRKKI